MFVGLTTIVVRVATHTLHARLPGAGRFVLEIWLVLTWFDFGGLFLHTYHQLRQISYIYTTHTRIDLDQYRPLFELLARRAP